MSTVEENIGVWLAIVTGIITGLATCFAAWREWQTFRQNQVTRLGNAAMVAVRRTEAAVVRPLLTARMSDIVARFVQEHQHMDPIRFRTLLFSELYASLRLMDDEKKTAKATAVNHFIDILREMPNPPMRIHSETKLNKRMHAIHEQVETAYSLRPRAGAELLGQLAQFSGGAYNTATT